MLLKHLLSFLPAIHRAFKDRRQQTVHFWIIVTIFAGLGFFVGVWTVLLADLARELALSPQLLGIALSSFSCSGIVALVSGSYLIERLSRQTVLLVGVAGLGLFAMVLSSLSQFSVLLTVFLCGGVCTSCYDLAANTLGGDYERLYGRKTMVLFHAGFSGGAAPGAALSTLMLSEGVGFRTVYLGVGLLFLLLALILIWCPLPAKAPASGASTDVGREQEHTSSSEDMIGLLITPVVLLAVSLVSLSFFTDSALEGYISVYLRDLLGSGVLLGGLGIAAYHLTGFAGRLGGAAALRRYGERRVITLAGTLTLLGMALTLATTFAPLAVIGLLLVGIGQSPIVPTAFSLAGQRGASAVAIVTAFGYMVFLVTPLFIGTLAGLFSLRAALLLTIVTSTVVVLVAQRLPGRTLHG
jgi:predicted MFS family arabinose efflux permease